MLQDIEEMFAFAIVTESTTTAVVKQPRGIVCVERNIKKAIKSCAVLQGLFSFSCFLNGDNNAVKGIKIYKFLKLFK